MHSAFLLLALVLPGAEPPFADIQIEQPFRTYLLANPLLMDTTGAKVVTLPDGKYLVLSVASVPLKDGSRQERLEAEKVCRETALRDLVRTSRGIQIASVQKSEDRLVVTVEKGERKVTAVSEYLAITTSRVVGMAQEMPVVGRWFSPDRQVLYLATGMVCDRKGDRVREEAAVQEETGTADTPAPVVTVEASGAARTADEAIKQALLAAVRQVVGSLVDGETLIKDSRLISEKVLTFSDGFVTEYKELESRQEGDFVIKKIRARVERGKVISKLRASKVLLKNFDGRGAFAKIVTQMEVEKEARQFIRRLVQAFPANVLQAEVKGEPEVVDRSETEVTLAYKVSIAADPERYQTFLTKTLTVLQRAASHTGTSVLRGRSDPAGETQLLNSILPEASSSAKTPAGRTPSPLRIRPPLREWEWWTREFDPRMDMIFLVNTQQNTRHDHTAWTWFHVPVVELPPPDLRLTIRLLDRDGKAIKEESVSLGPNLFAYNYCEREVFSKQANTQVKARQVMISPFLVSGYCYCPEVILNRKVVLSLAQLRAVDKMHCTLGTPGQRPDPPVEQTADTRTPRPPVHRLEPTPDVKTEEVQTPPPPKLATIDPEKTPAPHVVRADAHRRKGDYDKAIKEYTIALELSPDHAPALAGRAAANHGKRSWERAIADCDETIRLDPKYAPAYAIRGDAHRQRGDLDRCLADCVRAIHLDPKNAFALSVLADCQRRKGYLEQARTSADEALGLDPHNALAHAVRAAAWQAMGEFDRAIGACAKALELDPTIGLAHEVRAEAYRRKRDFDQAIADCDEALRLDENSAPAYSTRAAAEYSQGRLEKARLDCDKALLRDADNALAHATRGAVWQLRGQLDKAIGAFSRAIELDPKNALAYAGRGDTYRLKGDYDQALSDCDMAIRFDAGNSFVFGVRADTRRQKCDYNGAIADCDEAVRLDAKNAFAYGVRAGAYNHKLAFDRAIADCDRAMTLQPANAFVCVVRSEAYRQKGDLEQAIADGEAAIRLDAKYAFGYHSCGMAYHSKGDLDKAIANFDQALKLGARISVAYGFRGDAHRRKGDLDKAIADSTQAIQLEPQYALAYATRGESYRRKGELDKAIADCDKAIQFDPNAAAFATRGDALRQKGDLSGAIADLSEAIRLDPKFAFAYESRSQAYAKKGFRYKLKARDDHKKAMRLDADLGKK